MLSRSWKKPFHNGIIIPTKLRRCNECKDGMLCTTCKNQVHENEKFEAKLNDLKRKPPKEFGQMPLLYTIG